MPQPFSTCRRQFLCSSAGLFAGIAARTAKGADDAVPAIDERIRRLAAEAPLAMTFRGTTAAECRQWQAAFAAKLRSLLGPHTPPAQWQTVVERRVDRKDHRCDELVLTAEGYPPLPVYLLLPHAKSEGRYPGVLALHGHGNAGYDAVAGCDDRPGVAAEIKSANYDYGRQLVQRGYAVAVPCLTPFGRRLGNRDAYGKQDPCAITFLRLQLLGKVLMAENLRDSLWALNLLAQQDQVDPRRLACVGLSYGGRMAMLTTALEPRIQVAVVSGALNVMQERVGVHYSCGAQIIPGLLQYGDVPEIGSLIAPRPCVWEVGSRDSLVAPRWAEDALRRMRRAYKALDAEKNLLIDRFEGGHRWHGEMAYTVLANAWLK